MQRLASLWWLIGAVMLGVTIAATVALRQAEVDRRDVKERAAQHQTVLLLRSSVEDVIGRELAMGRVIGALHGKLDGRWAAVSSVVANQPAAHSVGFVQPVAQRDIAALERRTGTQVLDSPSPGTFRPTAVRPMHMVLTHSLQKGVDVPLVGLDLAANDLRRTLMLRAARTGEPVATPPVEFLTGPTKRHGVIVYVPVRSSRGSLLGWVSAAYGARELAALVTARAPGTALSIRDGDDVLLAKAGKSASEAETVPVAGRRWTVRATAPVAPLSRMPWIVLFFGAALAAATSLILRQAATRERHAMQALARYDAEEVALRHIATLVAEHADSADVFAAVAEEMGNLFDVETAAISRFDPPNNVGIVVGGRTRDGRDLAGVQFALDGLTASAQVYQRGGQLASRADDYTSPDDPVTELMTSLRASGGIAAPIVVAGELWGALGAAYTEAEIPEGVEERLERFARLVGLTISNTEAWAQLAREASTDALTGLANRRVFNDQLNTEIARAKRHGRSLAVAVLDIDHFKQINDTFGHQAGDDALVRFAQLLQSHIREGELCARIGGEEFAWLMPETDHVGAFTAADRVRGALAAELLPTVGRLTVSAGVSVAEPGLDAAAIVGNADQALYWAKEGGRNMVFIYSEQERERRPAQSS